MKETLAYPLTGYDLATVKGGAVLLTLRIIALAPGGQEVEQSLPFQILAAQTRELGEALLRAATAAEMGQAPTTSRN